MERCLKSTSFLLPLVVDRAECRLFVPPLLSMQPGVYRIEHVVDGESAGVDARSGTVPPFLPSSPNLPRLFHQISQRTKPAAPATSTGPAPEGVTAQTLATESQPEPEVDPNAFSPFERLFSRTVFWSYLVLTPPITIMSVMVGLLLIEE